MLNKQIPIKQDLSGTGIHLWTHSVFYTIQGEGPFAGSPAVFVRLMGCNLQCPSCDTEYDIGSHLHTDQLIGRVLREWPHDDKRPLVVITGGEPFRQNLSPFVNQLLDMGMRVQIETNGTLYVDLGWAFAHDNFTIVCSPKAGKVNKFLQRHIKAYKYVLNADSVDPTDGLPILALDHTASPRVARPHDGFTGDVFIQPVDVQNEKENQRHLEAAVASSLKFGYRLCLQLHKIIQVP